MDTSQVIEVLLVDDNPADLDLFTEVLAEKPLCHISTAQDGEQALGLLYTDAEAPAAILPDLIVLDLNLPRKDGRAVLADVKSNPTLRTIPVLVFTTSEARHDIERAYELGANCYVSKPGNLNDFIAVVKSIEDFWLSSAHLPRRIPV